MYSEKLEELINAALMDSILTEKEKKILFKKAEEEGIDLDEFEMILDSRLFEKQKISPPISATVTPSTMLTQQKEVESENEEVTPLLELDGDEFWSPFLEIYLNKLKVRNEYFNNVEDIRMAAEIMDATQIKNDFNIIIRNCFDYVISEIKNVLSKEAIKDIKSKRDEFLSEETFQLYNLLSELDNKNKLVFKKFPSKLNIKSQSAAVNTAAGILGGMISMGKNMLDGFAESGALGAGKSYVNDFFGYFDDSYDRIIREWKISFNNVQEELFDKLLAKLSEVVFEIFEENLISITGTSDDFDFDTGQITFNLD